MHRINTKLFCLLAVITFICLASLDTQAQTITSGAIRGNVYEVGTRAPILGATVTVTNRETGLIRSALTDASGEYFIKVLPVGVYTVNGEKPDYETVPTSTTNIPVRILDPSVVTPPPIELRKLGTPNVAATRPPAGAQPPSQGASQTSGQTGATPADVTESEQLVNTTNASRGQHFDSRQMLALP